MRASGLAARRAYLGMLEHEAESHQRNWALISLRSLFSWAGSTPTEPRVAARPVKRRCGGQEWTDEYSWLEAGGTEVQRVLRAERRYAEGWLARSAALTEALHGEMLAEVPPAQITAPELVGGHEYWVEQLPGRPHPCYLRRAVAPPGGQQAAAALPEVVLDVNELAAVHGEYVQVGQMKLSRCAQRVAFTLEAGDGEESYAAFTRDLRTGATRHIGALGGMVSLEWAADGATLLATQANELGRPWRVLGCHTGSGSGGSKGSSKGSGCSAPWVLFEEGDERFFVELGRTKDWSYLTINCNSKSASEVHLVPSDLRHLQPEPRLVQLRAPGLEYFVEHNGGQLYILSNARGAANYGVFRVPTAAADLGQEQWQVVVPEVEGVANEDMDMTRGWLVLYQRREGRQAVAALPLREGLPAMGGLAVETVAAATAAAEGLAEGLAEGSAAAAPTLQMASLPGWALSVAAGANADFEATRLRLMLSSPVHPEAAFDWELGSAQLVARLESAAAQNGTAALAAAGAATGARSSQQQQQRRQKVPKQQPELGWQQLWATSHDGTRVPLTVAHAAGLGPSPSSSSSSGSESTGSAAAQRQPHPCLLVVYGAYGHCLPTEHLAERLPLLRRGWVLALAHVRGGGELGRRWHAGGRGCAKANSVADLEACLDHLVAAGYTRPGLVALEAHSAGGLTAGALLNRRPGAIGAALLEAPFVDVLSAMCQQELPLTVHEYEEWGDPSVSSQFEQIRELCPYQNVHPAAYPPTLLTCSQADLRVPFWGPLKHAARLRAAISHHANHGSSGSSSGGSSGSSGRGDHSGKQQQRRQAGPILLLPDGQAGHFVHERDLYETKAAQYAFLAAALEGTL